MADRPEQPDRDLDELEPVDQVQAETHLGILDAPSFKAFVEAPRALELRDWDDQGAPGTSDVPAPGTQSSDQEAIVADVTAHPADESVADLGVCVQEAYEGGALADRAGCTAVVRPTLVEVASGADSLHDDDPASRFVGVAPPDPVTAAVRAGVVHEAVP